MDILSYGDYSSLTGFGGVIRGILHNLPKSWNIHHLGLSYNPHVELGNIPKNINVVDGYDRQNDPFGRKRFIKIMQSIDINYNLVFMLQDSFILSSDIKAEKGNIPFIEAVHHVAEARDAKVVVYTPMDQPRPYIEWFDTVLENSDQLVYYLDWARNNADYYSELDHKNKTRVIHHGVDRDSFFPVDSIQKYELRNQFGLDQDEFVILFGGANQRRKNIPHDVMSAFTKLYEQTDQDVKLLMKTDPHRGSGNGEGWNLSKIAKQLYNDFEVTKDSIQFVGSDGGMLPREKINQLYNVADAIYNPSCEGWGMWVTEAMCTRTPTIVGNHASLSEIGDYGRSLQVKTSNKLEDRVWFTDDWSIYRSQINLDSFVANVKNLMEMSDGEKNKMLDRAENSDYTKNWKSIANQWRELFQRVINE